MLRSSEPTDGVIEVLRDGMPPTADAAALRRVHARALMKHKEQRTWLRTHPWRSAGGAVAMLAFAAALALVASPRADTSAFAANEAADALLMQTSGRVLHIQGTWMQTGENTREGHDSRRDLDQRCDYWYDPAHQAMRSEAVNTGDGSLDNVSVQIDRTIVTFQDNVRFGTGDAPQLVKTTVAEAPAMSTLGGAIDYLRARLNDGSAEAIGTQVIDGEEYWVVEHRAPLEDILTSNVLTATMRKSDYRIKTWTWTTKYFNGDGRGSMTTSGTFDVIEQLDPGMLPADFFTFESVMAVAGPDVQLTIQEYVPPPDE